MTHVLVVDDNPQNCKLVAFLMKHHGYEVATASDATGALVEIARRRPSLILMDLQLPGVDGLELTRSLKANPATAEIRIVAVTAYAMSADRQRALAAGCDDFVTKPIDTRTLPALVSRHVDAQARGHLPSEKPRIEPKDAT
jgi:two-component system, cell cycle response regulator DivK